MRSETMCECLVHVSVNQVLLKSLLFGDGLYYLIELFQLFRGVIKPNKRAYFDVIGPLLAVMRCNRLKSNLRVASECPKRKVKVVLF